jgi:hypothetical protein
MEPTSGPGAAFQPAQAPAPTPLSMDHFGHAAAHSQHNFYAPHMMAMNMQQAQNHMMQPLDQQLSFGGYGLPGAADMGPGQGLIGGASDWDATTTPRHGPGPDPKSSSHHPVMNGHHPAHGHLGAPNGINVPLDDPSAAWYMSYGLEPTQLGQDMGIDPGSGDPFSNIYAGNGMSTSNPLGGLRHAQ